MDRIGFKYLHRDSGGVLDQNTWDEDNSLCLFFSCLPELKKKKKKKNLKAEERLWR